MEKLRLSARETLQRLITFPSVSQSSNVEISSWIAEQLRDLGFAVECSEYLDARGIRKMNVIGCRTPTGRKGPAAAGSAGEPSPGKEGGGLAYFGHSDVVPADHWTGPGGDPFVPIEADGRIYGRGACDMKGSLSAMLEAVADIPVDEQTSPCWFVCTADEEVGFEGAKHMVAESSAYRHLIANQPMGIIGEPTSLRVVHAHKGIEVFRVTSRGRAAHSSTGQGLNANLAMVPFLQKLADLHRLSEQDPSYHDPRFDPPTLSWTFGVSDSCRAYNITPERSVAWVSFRTMPEIDGEDLIRQARHAAESLGLTLERLGGGGPLWVAPDAPFVQQMCDLTGGSPETVCYSTDGGQFNELRARLVCGPGDISQAHTTDEWISLDQLDLGVQRYRQAIRRWCCHPG